jgi:hypothetical protein
LYIKSQVEGAGGGLDNLPMSMVDTHTQKIDLLMKHLQRDEGLISVFPLDFFFGWEHIFIGIVTNVTNSFS